MISSQPKNSVEASVAAKGASSASTPTIAISAPWNV